MRWSILLSSLLASPLYGAAATSPPPSAPAVPSSVQSNPSQTDIALTAPSDAETVDLLTFGGDGNDRMTVPVHIGKSGPYNFVVDTGAERTVISRELAGQLQLDPGGSAQLHSMTGTTPVETVIIPMLGVSSGTVRDIRAPALSRIHLGAVGMLGIDSLKNNQVLLDFRQGTMTIRSARAGKRGRADPDEIVVTARSRFGQLILADAEANGHKIAVIIDTGSQVSIGNSALRRKVLGKKPRTPPDQVEMISVTGGRMLADYTHIKEIRIGGITLTDLPIAFADAHPFVKLGLTDKPALMLGMNGLRAFDRVALDFANRKVSFLLPEGGGRDHDLMLAARP